MLNHVIFTTSNKASITGIQLCWNISCNVTIRWDNFVYIMRNPVLTYIYIWWKTFVYSTRSGRPWSHSAVKTLGLTSLSNQTAFVQSTLSGMASMLSARPDPGVTEKLLIKSVFSDRHVNQRSYCCKQKPDSENLIKWFRIHSVTE